MSNNHISGTEFATLCQSQISLLADSLGAVWSIVYLTEEVIEDGEAQLIPFAIYPHRYKSLSKLPPLKLSQIWQQLQSRSSHQLLPVDLITQNDQSNSNLPSDLAEKKQLILPLIHQENFIGLLVTGREDREWRQVELEQIEEIARTLAIARFLELQYCWTQKKLTEQENLRRVERDRIDTLIHQLRNPLTALRTFSKLLLKRFLPEDSNHKVATSLLEQSDRFQHLLEQFEFQLNENNPFKSTTPLLSVGDNTVNKSNFLLPSSDAELSPIDLREILQPILNTAQAIAAEKNIHLKINIPASIPEIKGDASALREIFNNLIDNAFKYTPSDGTVEIDTATKYLASEVEMLGVAISDTGYGIPLADRERIFERHYRGIQAQSDIPGTGLGLAIAKELAVKMQGEIELISPNHLSKESPGTTFIVWLPVFV